MRTRTKALIGICIAAAIGGIALASYAERGHGGMGFFAKGQFGLIAVLSR